MFVPSLCRNVLITCTHYPPTTLQNIPSPDLEHECAQHADPSKSGEPDSNQLHMHVTSMRRQNTLVRFECFPVAIVYCCIENLCHARCQVYNLAPEPPHNRSFLCH